MRWLLLVLLCLPAQAEVRRVGLFVGSNAAPVGRELLQHAEADAARLRDVMVELGEMHPDDAKVLRSPDATALDAALQELAARSDGAEAFFYYSGHADDRALLLGATELPLVDLRAALDRLPATLAVHIVDACRSGALTRAKGPKLGKRFNVDVRPQAKGRVLITSSAAWEDAQESDRLGGSFFTLHLASGLRGAADRDGDGQVTLGEVYAYVYDRTVESTLATPSGPQPPSFRYDLRGRGDTVLTWLGAARTAALRMGAGSYVVFDQAGRVLAEVPHGAQRLRVAPGHYRVARRERDAVREGDFQLVAGQDVEVDPGLTRRVAHEAVAMKGGGLVFPFALFGGVQSPMGEQSGLAPMARMTQGVGMRWLEAGLRLGWSDFGAALDTPRLSYELRVLSAGLELRRRLRAGPLELSTGVFADLLWLTRTEVEGREAEREAFGAFFGALLGLGLPIGPVRVLLEGEIGAIGLPLSDEERAPAEDGDVELSLGYRALLGVGHVF